MYRNLKEVLEHKEELEFGKDWAEIETRLENQPIKVKKLNGDFTVDSLTTGMVSVNEFLNLLEYIVEQDLRVHTDTEIWLTCEVVEGLLELKSKLFSNRVALGMQKSGKKIGRPSPTEAIDLAIKLYRTGDYTGDQIQKMTGVSRSSLYRHMKKRGGHSE